MRRLLSLSVLLVILGAADASARVAVVHRAAGSVGGGYADGWALLAGFNHPTAIATDILGNVYVSDSANHVIRRLDPSGLVTTVAGQVGAAGYRDGLPGEARFSFPSGIAVGNDGAIYVADTGNHVIRRIMPNGLVETFAGKGGEPGSRDGHHDTARFTAPRGLTFDSSGTLWVTDTSNHTLRKLGTDGWITTVAGRAGRAGSSDGFGEDARFSSPTAIVVERTGNLLIVDENGLRLVTQSGSVTTRVPCGEWVRPSSIAFLRSGELLLAGRDHVIRVADANGCRVIAGYEGEAGDLDGEGENVRFYYPESMAADGDGVVWIADMLNDAVKKLEWRSERRRAVRR